MNVVLDLMIHDIDLIQSLVRAPITSIDAVGDVGILGWPRHRQRPHPLRQRLRCEHHGQPHQHEMERKLRIFHDDAYVSIDLQQKVLTVVRKPPEGSGATLGQVSIEERTYEQGDALRLEIEAFLDRYASSPAAGVRRGWPRALEPRSGSPNSCRAGRNHRDTASITRGATSVAP